MNFLRGIGWSVLAMGLFCVLLMFPTEPWLVWPVLAGFAFIFFATPTSRRDSSRVKPRRERGY